MWTSRIVAVLLLGLAACSTSENNADNTSFDADGRYQGPVMLVGENGTAPVVDAEDGTVVFLGNAIELGNGSGCTISTIADSSIGTLDSHGTNSDETVRQLASVQMPIKGQTCAFQTASGSTISFVVTDGLITVWHAGDDATIEASVTGTMSGGGAVTYRISGYR